MRQYTVEDIKRLTGDGILVVGNPEGRFFTHARPVLEAEPDTLVWISPAREDKKELAQQTRAGIVICDPTLPISDDLRRDKCFVVVDKPKLVFLRVVQACFAEQIEYGIHDTAWVHPESKIHSRSYIGPFTYVGISIIEEGAVIYGHCHIYDNVHIGNNVIVHAGTVIGSEGFGYERNDEGKLERFPHIGGVVIEDNVDIGANTCIDRGTLGDTIIREGAKINNLVHIAHNIVVGRDAAVKANAYVGGSVNIGDKATLAPSATIMDRISIGEKALIGLGAVVLHDVPDNMIVVGNPARELKKKT